MGETRVDLLHLLEDLRDAYPGAAEETILIEIMANSLDSGASRIQVEPDAGQATLTVADNGSGMQRRELARYHDLAASTKTRGKGIGFAGVGIKLGLLVSEEVLTETKRGKTHVATLWHLSSRHRAPWKWVPPPGLVAEQGTAVRLKLQNALSPLLDEGFLEGVVRRHFQPLLDPVFEPVLAPHYPHGVGISVNGRLLEKQSWVAPEVAPLEVRLLRKRKPSALGYLVREGLPLPDDRRGMAISTFGKIIKRGWDWLGLTPVTPQCVGGLIEVPALAACLTLNKGDFIRVGPRGAMYLGYRKAIQEAVSRQLTAWGDARVPAEEARRRVARPLERELERVLMDLSQEFPLLTSLVERHAGGQRRIPIGKNGEVVDGQGLVSASVMHATEEGQTDKTEVQELASEPGALEPTGGLQSGGEIQEPEPSEPLGSPSEGTLLPGRRGTRSPGRYGLSIQFEERANDQELGRLVESTIWVNTAHPAFRRASASRSEGYHVALSVALAVAPLAAQPTDEHTFVTAFLASWGEALERSGGGRRRIV